MSEFTNIAWCDSTWNWARGCDKVSPGCKNCYITTTAPFRTIGMKHGDPRIRAGENTFNAPLKWNKRPWICDCGTIQTATEETATCPKCKSDWHRRRVFSLSLGDWLDKKIPPQWLLEALLVMWRCQDIDFLLCSKRLEQWRKRLEGILLFFPLPDIETAGFCSWIMNWLNGKAPKNIWIIGSAENSKWMEKRAEQLEAIPAVVKGWSCEPLLGPLDFLRDSRSVDWVIFGGESGKGARPCNIDWIRNGNKQARALWPDCKIFNKQLGSNPSCACGELEGLKHPKGGDPAEWPADLRIQEWPDSAPR